MSKSWNKISSVVSEVLTSHKLKQAEVKSIMESVEKRKSEIVSATEPSSTRTSRKKKDKNAPKKARSGYIIFSVERRADIKAKHPTLSAAQLTTEIAKAWKAVSESEKKKWEEKAKVDKERYKKEMESYTPPEADSEPVVNAGGKAKKVKKVKDPNAPKNPRHAYSFFSDFERAVLKKENPDIKGTEVFSEIGKRWKTLSDDKKAPFVKMASEDKARFEREKGTGVAPSASSKKAESKEVKETKPRGKKAEAKTESKAESKSSKKDTKFVATAGYNAFMSEQREEHPNWNDKKAGTECQKLWLALSSAEREEYESAVAEDNADSEAELMEEDDE